MLRSVLLVVSLAGCGSDDPSGKDRGQDPPEGVDEDCVRATFGVDGGTLEHPDGGSLVVDARDEGEVELCLLDDGIWEIRPVAVTGVLTLPGGEGDGLFLPLADGGHARSPLERQAPAGRFAPLRRGGTAWVAPDPTVFRPYGEDTTRVDVLVVLDSSGSMSEAQDDVLTQLPVLGDYLAGSGIDFRVGLITIDLDSPDEAGRLRPIPGGARWLDPTTPDVAGTFAELVNVGSSGSNNEQGLGAILLALDEPVPTENVGFRRDSARLVTLVVSNDNDFTSAGVVTLDDFVPWYREVGPFTDDAALHGIVSTVSPNPNLVPVSTRYIEVIDQLGGNTADIRDEDAWAPAMVAMMVRAQEVTWTTLADRAPVADTVQVWHAPANADPTPLEPTSWAWFEGTQDVRVDEALVPPGTPVFVSWVPAIP